MKKNIITINCLIFIFFFISCRQDGQIQNFYLLKIEKTIVSEEINTYKAILTTETLNEFAEFNWSVSNISELSKIEYSLNKRELILSGGREYLKNSKINLEVRLTNGEVLVANYVNENDNSELLEGGMWIIDKNLREAIRNKLGKNEVEEVGVKEVESMDGLDASNLNILSLEGLDKLSSIKGVWDLSNNLISNIQPLENLVVDSELKLDKNQFLFPYSEIKIVDGLGNIIKTKYNGERSNPNRRILYTIVGTVSINETEYLSDVNLVNVVIPTDLILRDYINNIIGISKLYDGQYALVEDVEKLSLNIPNQVLSLNGLQNINKINSIVILDNSNLENLNGLDNLEYIDTHFTIMSKKTISSALKDFSALGNLKQINDSLSFGEFEDYFLFFEAIKNLEIGGDLSFSKIETMENFEGIKNIKSIKGIHLDELPKFNSFSGFPSELIVDSLTLTNSFPSLNDSTIQDLQQSINNREISIGIINDRRI